MDKEKRLEWAQANLLEAFEMLSLVMNPMFNWTLIADFAAGKREKTSPIAFCKTSH